MGGGGGGPFDQYGLSLIPVWISNHTPSEVSDEIIYQLFALCSKGHVDTWVRVSALLALRAGNSQVTGEFPSRRPVTRIFDVFFDLRLNKRLSKRAWGWWFEKPSRPLWRHSSAIRKLLGLVLLLAWITWLSARDVIWDVMMHEKWNLKTKVKTSPQKWLKISIFFIFLPWRHSQ